MDMDRLQLSFVLLFSSGSPTDFSGIHSPTNLHLYSSSYSMSTILPSSANVEKHSKFDRNLSLITKS